MSDRDQVLRQIDRLTTSTALHGSESLCRLLRYLAQHALDHPGEPLKEYKIATEGFARPPDFDAQLDSMVRVQAGRLRAKLTEYYGSEGADDHIRVELPKGTYLLSIQNRTATPTRSGAHSAQGREIYGVEHYQGGNRIPRGWLAAVVILSAFVLLSSLALFNTRRTISTGPENKPAAAALQTFWKPFLDGPEEPLIVFSNAAFVGRPETGMRYYNPGHDSRDSVWDHYTGVGEVLAVHNLDQAFASLHRNIRVKRGSLFSLDDAKNNDLIFVGSPSENLTLLEISGTREFVFQRVDSGARKGDLAVVNVHPQAGEGKEYLASSSTSPLTEDYAVVALLHGLNPARSLMIVAGTTTFGTQGAIEYVCRQSSIEELLLRLSVSQSGEVQPFEALLRVKVTRGVPVETQLVSLRKIPAR